MLHIRSASREEFPEVIAFRHASLEAYGYNKDDIIEYQGDFIDQLNKMQRDHPHIRCILMGNRRTDPHSSHLISFTSTDAGWPDYMRVFPVLDWTYAHVWKFIRSLSLKYCQLYDKG